MLGLTIPWWGRWVALGALGLACMAFGWWKGHDGMVEELEAVKIEYGTFKTETAALGKVAEERVAKITADQKGITDALTKDYARKLAALPKFGGVRQPANPAGGEVAVLSCPAPVVNGAAADPVPAVAQADFDILATGAAQTTLILVQLQDWVRQQQAAFQ